MAIAIKDIIIGLIRRPLLKVARFRVLETLAHFRQRLERIIGLRQRLAHSLSVFASKTST